MSLCIAGFIFMGVGVFRVSGESVRVSGSSGFGDLGFEQQVLCRSV